MCCNYECGSHNKMGLQVAPTFRGSDYFEDTVNYQTACNVTQGLPSDCIMKFSILVILYVILRNVWVLCNAQVATLGKSIRLEQMFPSSECSFFLDIKLQLNQLLSLKSHFEVWNPQERICERSHQDGVLDVLCNNLYYWVSSQVEQHVRLESLADNLAKLSCLEKTNYPKKRGKWYSLELCEMATYSFQYEFWKNKFNWILSCETGT